jgi:hypothetical protein
MQFPDESLTPGRVERTRDGSLGHFAHQVQFVYSISVRR